VSSTSTLHSAAAGICSSLFSERATFYASNSGNIGEIELGPGAASDVRSHRKWKVSQDTTGTIVVGSFAESILLLSSDGTVSSLDKATGAIESKLTIEKSNLFASPLLPLSHFLVVTASGDAVVVSAGSFACTRKKLISYPPTPTPGNANKRKR
jgi:hypothetical protein